MKQGSTGGVLGCLLALVFSVEICQGRIKSFTVSSERGDDCILLNTDAVLVCDVDDDWSTLAIKRLKDGALIGTSRVGEKSLKYVIYNVSCSHMGTYVCILDNTDLLTADLVIVECPLQTCDGADVTRTLFVHVGDPVHFSTCVLACVDIAPHAKFNESLVRKNNRSDWTWNYAPITSTGLPITRFNVTVTSKRMDTEKYGLLRVRLFSLYNAGYYLDFHTLLQPPGPSLCPTDITVRNYGHDYAILSWKRGLDRGSRQHFYVYYSNDKVTWITHGSKTEDTIEIVSGLSSHTSYYFRVASGNEYITSVDASTCTRAVFVETKSLTNPFGLERSDILMLTLGVCLILSLMLLLSALFCWRRKANREHKRHVIQGQEEIPMEASQTGSSTCPGGYVTVDDIGYSLPSSQ